MITVEITVESDQEKVLQEETEIDRIGREGQKDQERNIRDIEKFIF